MKWMKNVNVAIATCMVTIGLTQAAPIEKPTVFPEAMLSITVSDLHGLIDGAGSVAAQVSPMINGMMLKNMIGMQLGDPSLAGIAPGKGLAVVALDQDTVFAIAEVNEAQAAAYTAALTQKGVQSKFVAGVLVAAPDAAQLEKAAGQVTAVQETLLAKRSPTLRIAAQPAALVEKNQAQIDGMLQMMPMMMGMGMQQNPGADAESIQNLSRILDAEIRVLLSLAKQCESGEIVLAPQDGSLRITETYTAKPGTRLATLLSAPKLNKPNPKVQSGWLDDAAISIDCTLANPEALTDFYCQELDVLLQAMGLTGEELSGLNELMKKSMSMYSGSFSENVSLGGESFMSLSYMLDVKDEAAALALLKSMEQEMEPFMNLYKSFGMPMTMEFKENTREHNGAQIHQFKVGLTMPHEEMLAAQSMNMNVSNMVFDVAISDGMMLYAMGEMKIESLLDRVKNAEFKPAPLKARAVYPADAFYYCDIDVAKYMTGISSILPQDPDNPMPQIAAMLQGADPVTSAGFSEDGVVMWSVNVPGSLVARIGQTFMTLQLKRVQGGPGAMPGGAPGGMPPPTMETVPVQ